MGIAKRLQAINRFVSNPDDEPLEISHLEKVKILITTLIYDFALAMFFTIVIGMLAPLTEKYEHKLSDLDLSYPMMLLIGCFVVPFFEELFFRLPLKYKRNYIFIAIDGIFKKNLYPFWKRNFKYIFYAFALAFGFVHITNYTNHDWLLYVLAPLLVGAQIMAGLLFGYLRIKLGFVWGFAGHFLHNALLFSMVYMFTHNVTVIDIKTDQLEFDVTRYSFKVDDDTRFKITRTDQGNLIYLNAKNTDLQQVIDTLFGVQSYTVKEKVKVDFNLQPAKDSILDKDYILQELEEHFELVKKQE